jgi:tRNA dimethylallyltransferase
VAAPPIFAIVGPTASGKTALALELAERAGAEIVSCDSMQVYRHLDVGTAKPTAGERARIPHHLIDVVEPDEPFSAARYVELADAAIGDLLRRGKKVVLVGGTGLYLHALRWGLFDAPPRDDELRARLTAEEEAAPGSLHARLREVDPDAAERIGPRDLVRIVRALEVHELTGRPISVHHAEHKPVERHPMRVVVLDPPQVWLAGRILTRAHQMIDAGLKIEAERAFARWGRIQPLQALGYREVGLMLDGKLKEEELVRAIASATVKYARRQRTWFKKEPDVLFCESVEATRAAAVDFG